MAQTILKVQDDFKVFLKCKEIPLYQELAWEPSVAQVTHCYSRRLPTLGRKLRF